MTPTSTKAATYSTSSETEVEFTTLMPCLNEAETLARCIDKARSHPARSGGGEVLVADNGRTDGSQAFAVAHSARVADIPARGHGAALMLFGGVFPGLLAFGAFLVSVLDIKGTPVRLLPSPGSAFAC
jgi:hypothetical protein